MVRVRARMRGVKALKGLSKGKDKREGEGEGRG